MTSLAVWSFAMALSGALHSAYLAYLELFVIDAVRVWCIASAVLMSAILLVTLPDTRVRRLEKAPAADGPPTPG